MVDLEAICAQQDALLRRIEAKEAQIERDKAPAKKALPVMPPILVRPPNSSPSMVLGNGPSLNTVAWDELPQEVTTYGVNRLPIVPDWYCALDKTVEDKWIPDVGECKGVVTTQKHRMAQRSDAHVRHWVKLPKGNQWQDPGENAYYNGRVSGAFMVQWALERGERDIGLLGIEYSSRALIDDETQDTHWFGRHDPSVGSPALVSRGRLGYRFWTALRDHCARSGIRLVDLVPYETPFSEGIGIPKMSLEDWLNGR